MALARVEDFSEKELKVADFARALSHPARVAILKALAEKKECICGDLVDVLPLAQSTVSQHLKALKDVGLIQGTIDGPRSRYCIDWKVFERYQREIDSWSEKLLKLRKDNCC
jgi:ArsR family transcriptional regulator, arsenate/arsenite/antimonite-responsive transcriptional repressor